MKIFKSLLLLSALSIPSVSFSSVIQTEVASNAYITVGGYDVAWIGPIQYTGAITTDPLTTAYYDFTYQEQFGWKPMTQQLFVDLGIDAKSFVFDGANVDYATGNNLDEATGAFVRDSFISSLNPTGDVAVAAPWFYKNGVHVDFYEGANGKWSLIDNSGFNAYEALAYREASAVSEPSPLPLMGLGVVALAFMRRKLISHAS